MEKGGLSARLAESGATDAAGLYWGDALRTGLMGQVCRGWAPCGVKGVQGVAYQRVWTSLNLAVNGLSGHMRWAWSATMKGASLAPIVKPWGEEGVSSVVWDRARGHRGTAYAEVTGQRIEQPAYSPELNPVERVFEYLRSKVEGRGYGTLEAKQGVIQAELEKLAAAPERVKSLAGWDWLRESVNSLSSSNTVFQ